MINIVESKNCCGCTSCASICPKGAISMQPDKEGFLYPVVDKDLCVDCNLCDKACAFTKENENNKPLFTYAVRHNSAEVLERSSSGGMFTAMSDYVLDKCGVVYGASFDDNFVIRHTRAESKEQRNAMCGSKYVQSDIRGIFSSIKNDLNDGRLVLFTGTPCQADGLKKFLGQIPENLIISDLICYGVPSPMVWKDYVDFISKINRSVLKEHYFRAYEYGWKEHIALSVFKNGKRYTGNAYSNLFTALYYSKLVLRPSCYSCPYTCTSRVGDITIADCRGIEKVLPDFECDNGASLVLVNTQKGKEFYDKIKDVFCSEDINLDAIMQPPLKGPAKRSARREQFWDIYLNKGFKAAIYWHFGRLYSLKQFIKKLIKIK
ncbi:MAG: 4Fe-4S dicluster domain-containing protein [Ruminococcaceae bacterium]|nr:4Fe-4S dicluster domain-containing protein [Oscillospiraceae bacterium]